MRLLGILLASACAVGPPPPAPKGPPPCDALPLLGAAEPKALASDAEGGVAVAGDFRGKLRAAQTAIEGAGVFVLRADPDGEVRWLRAISGAAQIRAHAVAVAGNGDVIVAGQADGRCFAARLAAADGKEQWKAAVAGDESACRALAPAPDGAVWVAGSFSGLMNPAHSRGMS